MIFRSDINGLRAIAVLAVMLFHFGIVGVQGGFVGVDVFFVISGYLMTSIIFRGIERQQFSLLGFYLDRGRRIIPALALLCLAVLVMGWFLLLPADYMTLARHAISSMTFSSNVRYFHEAGYFDTSSHGNWLLHTWSLSVEWQFYLLYPVVILALRKYVKVGWIRWGLAIATLLSFALSVYVSTRWSSAAFYLLPTRAWEMLTGALIFLFPIKQLSKPYQFAMELVGLGLIVLSIGIFTSHNIWPGFLAIVPVVGTALVIMSSRTNSYITGNPVAQFVGKTSYSVYLWHWPLVVALNYFGKEDQTTWLVAGVGVSILAGYLSFTWVEKPTRSLGIQNNKLKPMYQKTSLILLLMIIAVAGVGSLIRSQEGFKGGIRAVNHDEKALFVAEYDELHAYGLYNAYRLECDFYDLELKKSKTEIDRSCTHLPHQKVIFLWGDSHAQALSLGLRELFSQTNIVAQVATSGCRPSLGQQLVNAMIDNNCDHSNQYARQQIARLKPEVVVMAQAEAHEQTNWDEIARYLHAKGVSQVVLVGPMTNWRPSLPIVVTRAHWQDDSPYVKHGLDNAVFATNAILKDKYQHSKTINYVSLIDVLCQQKEGCIGVLPDKKGLLVVDYGHLSPSGSIYVAKRILAQRLKQLVPNLSQKD